MALPDEASAECAWLEEPREPLPGSCGSTPPLARTVSGRPSVAEMRRTPSSSPGMRSLFSIRSSTTMPS
jgi:hypothetical protein